eukprot:GEMP01036374.1.p1 GENE.GEMP01036374.1~~GEMP01036374.1.p1  ORF type:complete len:503 (+),score=151.51 GEMP01036374.1:97-1605(+)
MTEVHRGQYKIQDTAGKDIRMANICAARAVADTVRTSLGPKGMDKMIQDDKGEVIITNDGATILKRMSVVIIAGALLQAAEELLNKGIHPQVVTDAFLLAQEEACKILADMSIPVDLSDREALIKNAATSLNSKVVAQSANILAPIAVDAVLKVIDKDATNVDLRDVRVAKLGGAVIDDSELVDGLILTQKVSNAAGGPQRIENAKIGVIQFCLSPPKTDMDNQVVVKDYTQMDRILREERMIIAKMVKQIAATGCNVLLIQKSILRDAVTDLGLDFLAKMKIMVVRDIEREDMEFLSRILGLEPVASLDHFTADKLGHCDLVKGDDMGGAGSCVRFTGLKAQDAKCVSILVRSTNQLLLDETERSLHDALCVVRSLVKVRALIPGGAAPEMEVSVRLMQFARALGGAESMCVQRYAEAVEIVPYTLSENAGLKAIDIVTALRKQHAEGKKYAGVNVRKGQVTDMLEENVVQPLLVSQSIFTMATECVRMILKIDDIIMTRN